jgi:hypothetical protein
VEEPQSSEPVHNAVPSRQFAADSAAVRQLSGHPMAVPSGKDNEADDWSALYLLFSHPSASPLLLLIPLFPLETGKVCIAKSSQVDIPTVITQTRTFVYPVVHQWDTCF